MTWAGETLMLMAEAEVVIVVLLAVAEVVIIMLLTIAVIMLLAKAEMVIIMLLAIAVLVTVTMTLAEKRSSNTPNAEMSTMRRTFTMES